MNRQHTLALGLTFVLGFSRLGQAAQTPTWWNTNWQGRVPVAVKTIGTEETDAPVQVRLNFTALLKEGEQVDAASLRVVEQDAKTGAVIAELPALCQPVDDPWKGVAPLNWQKPYDAGKPPLIRATSENPAHPAKSLIEGQGYWEAGSPTPPWMLAIDLGDARTINAIFPRTVFDGGGHHIANNITVETALESADGLRTGTWDRVAFCVQPTPGNNFPICFPPRQARYVRMTIGGCNGQQPWIGAFDVYKPFFDAKERSEWRLSWFAPGRTGSERSFLVYFNKQTAGAPAQPMPPLPEKIAVLREAEEAINTFHCSGVGFGKAFDQSASGPTNPNILSFNWSADHFTVPAGFAVTLPRSGKYTIALRARGNSGDHFFRTLWDNQEVFRGAFGIEGEGWNMILLPPMDLTAGVHYLELETKLGLGNRPIDIDLIVITDARDYKPRQCLQAVPAQVEVRP